MGKYDPKVMRRIAALGLTVLAPLILLILVTQVVVAQQGELADSGSLPEPIGELGPMDPAHTSIPQSVTRVQTATLLPQSDPLTSPIPTRWENLWLGFDVPMFLVYPQDVVSSEVHVQVFPPTVTVVFTDLLKQVRFFPPPSVPEYDVFIIYTTTVGLVYTDSDGTRLEFNTTRFDDEGRFRAQIGGWLNTGYFLFTSTLNFPDPYRFLWATAIPTNILTYTLEPSPEPHWIQWALSDVVSFLGKVDIRDVRVRSDLVMDDVYIDPVGTVTVTAGIPVLVKAVVRNQGEVMPDLPYFYTEWYARPVGYGPPADPDDHDYGWCARPGDCGNGGIGRYQFIFDADPGTPDHPLPAFPDPVPTLRPGESTELERTYIFFTPGTYELWAQADVDIQHDAPPHGPNLELDEGNNVAGPLTIVVEPNPDFGGVYLPIIVRNF